MNDPIGLEQRRDLARRGFSRRDFARIAGLLTAGATLPFYNEAALAQGLSAAPDLGADAVRINANENPMGPCPEAIEAINAIVAKGAATSMARRPRSSRPWPGVEGLSRDYVLPFAGSSDPLHRAVLAFTSPTKCLVIADPGYEAGEKAARFLGAKVIRVPLRKDGSHDVKAMVEADPNGACHLRLQPEQPDRHRHPQGRHRLPRRPQARGGHRAPRRGVYPPVDDRRAGHAARQRRQGRGDPPDLLQALRDGRLPGRGGVRPARPAEADQGASAPGPCPSPGWSARRPASRPRGWSRRAGRSSATSATRRPSGSTRRATPSMPSEANMLMIDVRTAGPAGLRGLLKEKVAIGRILGLDAQPRPGLDRHPRRDGQVPRRFAFDRVVMNA